jgi:DNA-binding transcriptional LysR family regulator
MDLKTLEVFCKIVELGSFSRAAEAVSLTQPTVSGHIKALESEVGIRLLDRVGKRVRPTRAGELLYGYSRRILVLREEAQQALSEHKGGLKGHLPIGGSSIPGAYILPSLVGAFKRDHPDVTIALCIRDSREVVRSVIEGTYELGVVGARFEEGRVRYDPFGRDELVLAVPASHPWAGRTSVRLHELEGQPFVLRERGSGTRKVMEAALAAQKMDPGALRVALEVTGSEAVRQVLKAGVGVAVISRRAIEDDVRNGTLAALRVSGIKLVRDFYLVTHKSRSRSPVADAFLAFLRAGDSRRASADQG